MRTVIYNPNCVDSVFTAAILQTQGWTPFSNRERVDINEGTFIWLGVLPARAFMGKGDKPDNKHYCFVRGCKMNAKIRHTLIQSALYGEEQVLTFKDEVSVKEKKEAEEPSKFKRAFTRVKEFLGFKISKEEAEEVNPPVKEMSFTIGRRTIIEQVCAVENINFPELHILSNMVRSFREKHIPREMLANIVLNMKSALEALRTGEIFQVQPLSYKRNEAMSNSELTMVIDAQDEVTRMQHDLRRYFFNGAVKLETKSERGFTRMIQAFNRDDWWFIRRRLSSTDLGFNMTLTPAGLMIDATGSFDYDFGFGDKIEAYTVLI